MMTARYNHHANYYQYHIYLIIFEKYPVYIPCIHICILLINEMATTQVRSSSGTASPLWKAEGDGTEVGGLHLHLVVQRPPRSHHQHHHHHHHHHNHYHNYVHHGLHHYSDHQVLYTAHQEVIIIIIIILTTRYCTPLTKKLSKSVASSKKLRTTVGSGHKSQSRWR